MPQVTISQSLYDRLQKMAIPFEDTPESVIARCVDFYDTKGKTSPTMEVPVPSNWMVFPADAPPDLKFTRPISATLDGKNIEKALLYWNAMLFEAVRLASKKLPADVLRRSILVNFTEGEGLKEKGYRFIPEAGLSVQGQDANAAWRATFHLVKMMDANIKVIFNWDVNDKSAFPGKTAQMAYEV